MGNEVRGLMKLKESDSLRPIRLFILLFAISALLFSLISSDELVLLARLSFSGTAIMGPLIILGILANKPQGMFMVWISLLGLIVFILTQLNLFPQKIGLLRMDLLIMIVLSLGAFGNYLLKKK
jgi:SSS family solute:Na+ symporter